MSKDNFDSLDMEDTLGPGSPGVASGYALSAGEVLGQYRILSRLGKGGMGEVYLAENTLMRKQIALKLLPASATGGQPAGQAGSFVDRFRIEARVMADLHHPGIVQVHHAGEENGRYYLTMDYVCSPSGEPQTLEDLLTEQGQFSEAVVKSFALQICDALALAHGQGLVHRDLKPANMLIGPDGRIRITDFGLAKVVGDEYLRTMIDRSISLSMAGEVSIGDEATLGGPEEGKKRSSARALLGTYEYMAPEQKSGGEISAQTDLYAVGIILYRLLTGEKPEGLFDLPSEFGCAEGWDEIIRVCMQKKPERRPATVAALLAMLEEIESGLPRPAATQESAKGVPVQPPPAPAKADKAARNTGLSDLMMVQHAEYAPLDGLAPGSAEAQNRQRAAVVETGLPLEVKSAKTGIVFRLVPAGTFTMGSPSNESERTDAEKQHAVTISKPFYCGKYPVTQGQWEAVMGSNPSHFKGAQNPVEQVSWIDAVAFCKKLTNLERQAGRLPEGFEYRLPTEAQWEYACRAGTTGSCAGDLDSMAWYDSNSGNKTHPVGTKQPNAWGLYDMHGNVCEECLDDWHYSYSGAPSDGSGWGDGSGSYRVERGGSCGSSASYCRSASRSSISPDDANCYLGFRVCLVRK